MPAKTAARTSTAITEIRGQVDRMEGELQVALPKHIGVDRFKRIALTAINSNPDLWECDQRSLMAAVTKAAQDGLLPDGREGAFVIFKTKDKKTNQFVKRAVWMPMVWGIVKKVRNSGELSTITANVVYQHDAFDYELGDNERIYHKPALMTRGNPIGAYAIAHLKDGAVEREFMSLQEIDQVRAVSKSGDSGPWGSWWSEMARKTVIRRLSKRLPTSDELANVFHSDDDLYNRDPATTDPEVVRLQPPRPQRGEYMTAREERFEAERGRAAGMAVDEPEEESDTAEDGEPAGDTSKSDEIDGDQQHAYNEVMAELAKVDTAKATKTLLNTYAITIKGLTAEQQESIKAFAEARLEAISEKAASDDKQGGLGV